MAGIIRQTLAFGAFVPVRYVQHSALSGRGAGITVTAYAAGHMLGGAVWKVHKEAEDVVYAVDYNHRKEKHLNGRGLHSSTFRLNISAVCGMMRASRGCSGGV